jgi:hypothetical protein
MTDENTEWESLLDDFECEDCDETLVDCTCDSDEEYEFDDEDEE